MARAQNNHPWNNNTMESLLVLIFTYKYLNNISLKYIEKAGTKCKRQSIQLFISDSQ